MNMIKYIGKPYDRYNCFDLVKEFYLDQFNIDLRHYYEGDVVPDRKDVETLIVSNKGDFVKITDKPKFGDIVIISLYGLECHIGVCLDENRFLHSTKNIGSNMDSLKRYSKIIAGFFRHREK